MKGKNSIIFADHETYDFFDSVHNICSLCALSEITRKVLGPPSKKESAELKESGISYTEAVKSCSFDASGSTLFEEKIWTLKKLDAMFFKNLTIWLFSLRKIIKNSINQ